MSDQTEQEYWSNVSQDDVSYLPGVSLIEIQTHQTRQIDNDNTVNEQPLRNHSNDFVLVPPTIPEYLSTIRQTARSRTSSDSSGSHTPTQANTPPQSPGAGFDDCAATGRSREQSIDREERIKKDLALAISLDDTRCIYPPSREVHNWQFYLRGPDQSERTPSIGYYMYPDYFSKEARLDSFKTFNWPLSVPSSTTLAENDMFYLGPGMYNGNLETDLVHCYKCGGILCRFEPHDDPRSEHRKGSPECFNTVWRKP